MKCLVSYLTRKARGGVARKDESIDTDALRLGRGADCNVHLVDQRILLNHAEIAERPGGYFIEAAGQSEIRVNGVTTHTSKINPGDVIGLGPYELTVQPPTDGHDFALAIELTHPLGDDLAQLRERSHTSLSRIGLTKRGWSWLLAVVVLALFLGLPVAAHFMSPVGVKEVLMSGKPRSWPINADVTWKTGELSGPHKFFGDNCGACHQKAFSRVPDEACVTCHTNVRHHADTTKFQFAGFAGQRCESCHQEHNGSQTIVLRDQNFCASCHGDLKARSPDVTVGNATDFGTNHPQFRPTVLQDAASGKVIRAGLDANPKPEEHSGLKFPHDKHLKPEGIRNPDKGMVKLDCGTCHKPAPGGATFLPIRMTDTCQGCHALRFDARGLDRQVPHGNPAEAQRVMRDFYAALALRGEVQDDAAPEVVRRRPGQELQEPERKAALAWAESKAVEQADLVIGKTLCASCHVASKQADGQWQIAPVKLAQDWLPNARFVHNKHNTVNCDTCHEARKSDAATDVLIPTVQTCQTCHGGEKSAAKVPSTCISCHVFHRPDMPPFAGRTTAANDTKP